MPKPSPALSAFLSQAANHQVQACAIAILTKDGEIGWIIQATSGETVPLLGLLPLIQRDLIRGYYSNHPEHELKTYSPSQDPDPNLN